MHEKKVTEKVTVTFSKVTSRPLQLYLTRGLSSTPYPSPFRFALDEQSHDENLLRNMDVGLVDSVSVLAKPPGPKILRRRESKIGKMNDKICKLLRVDKTTEWSHTPSSAYSCWRSV